MAEALVTLKITLVGGDEDASLFWCNEQSGEEQRYGDVIRYGAAASQETFAGHKWCVRGKTTGDALLRITAQAAPALQEHRIDAGGEDAEFIRPGRARGERPSAAARQVRRRDVAAENGGSDGDAHAADESEPDATTNAEATVAAEGVWLGDGGICRFERQPARGGFDDAIYWREVDVDGREVGRLRQVDARVDTQWLWWANAAYRRLAGMSHQTEYFAMCALSIAGAYNIDYKLPRWLSEAVGGRLGPNPLMLLLLTAVVVGALVAAALPLTEATLFLRSTAHPPMEVRLSDAKGFSRELTPDPARPRAWMLVSNGGWATLPPDLAEMRSHRTHHAVLVAAAVAWGAMWVARQQGQGWSTSS